jgi:geranylgeranyl diphosphate synthase type I
VSSQADDWSRALAFLDDYRGRADERLARLLAEENRGLLAEPFAVDRYHALLSEYVLRGGKRLRGALVVLGYQAVSPASDARALEASLAFELLHAFLLAYDDFMDRDELRRGGASLHVLTAREAASRGVADDAHRGVSVMLLLGLLAQSQAFRCLDRAGASGAARAYFDDVTRGVVLGQLLDVVAVDAPSPTFAEISRIHQLKTGLYTTEGPLVLGALLAGAASDSAAVRALRGWAVPLGEAFQLVDDVLGVVGESEVTGKPASGDLREGKRSAVIEEALARLEGGRRAALAALAGRPLDAVEAERARALVVGSGAVEAVRERARALARQGSAALSGGVDPDAAGLLSALARLIVERQN